ncbi:MAG TPA: LacI family DNA-binding transcriptional regulator [Terriglobales bacterium]|nr:LacI family DNA-binding transcriptional regulator [Terriglobales bacterium]
MYTIRDIARLAGVSVATVSGVLNNKPTVKPALVQRVKEAMDALDYHPDQVARSLRLRHTCTVGMVIADVTNPFFTDVIRGVEKEAQSNGYSVILCDANEDPVLERHYLSTLFSRRVDGVLLAPTSSPPPHESRVHKRFPIVLIDRIPLGYVGDAVMTDNFSAAYEGTRHLMELGHRKIAIITGQLNLSNGLDRLDGFRKALQEEHLVLPDSYLQRGDFQLESGYRCGLQLMRLPTPPTAIFSCNNRMTLGLMRALGELHVNCPGAVSVLGFDDFEWSAYFTPRLTTIAQPAYEMGKQAMQILLRKLKAGAKNNGLAEEIPETRVRLKAELRVRDSTAAPASVA